MATSIKKVKLKQETFSGCHITMAQLLFFQVLFFVIHLGCAEEDLIHNLKSLNTPGTIYGESYAVRNGRAADTDNESATAYAAQHAPKRDGDLDPGGLSPGVPNAESTNDFIPDLDADCLQLLKDYANVSTHFVYCALEFSKPLLFCETCVDKFTEANRKFKEIEKMSTCDGPLLRSDRVQILRETHEFLRELWNKGSCSNCFKDMSSCEKRKQPCGCTLTDDVVKFQKQINQTHACFDEASASGENVCTNCSVAYRTLGKFFHSMGGIEDICVDCVELMNSTRKEWSTIYNCTHAERDIVSVVSISIFFCSLPIFFYFGSKVHTTKTELKLMKLNRMNKPHTQARPSLPTLPEHGDDFLTHDRT